MEFVVGVLVAVLFGLEYASAIECYSCTGSDHSSCSLTKTVNCDGNCISSLSQALNFNSIVYMRRCIPISNIKMDGCQDSTNTVSGVTTNTRQCYCSSDLCNDKIINSSSTVSRTPIQCYQCKDQCYSPKTVSCTGNCFTYSSDGRVVNKDCMTNIDTFGSGLALETNTKFTGCMTMTYQGSKTAYCTCQENLCNRSTGSSRAQPQSILIFLFATVSVTLLFMN